MGFLARTLFIASILLLYSIPSSIAQDSKKEATGSISGRVKVGGTPAARVTVVLRVSDRGQSQQVAKTTTDEDGRFTIKAVPAGSYMISPHTPALVAGTDNSPGPSHTVSLSEGEDVDGIDFSLIKGGVITGRVTDADGRPLIEQRVQLIPIDERGQRMPTPFFNPGMFTTDDRGVYRLFGLMPGRYKVSVGDAPDGTVRIGFGGGSYPRTFHPDVSDEGRATIVELSSGSEAAGIDIKLGRASKTYVATGRIVDADTGKPIANVQYGHGALNKDQRMTSGFGWTGNRSTASGDFRIDGLTPGRYAAFVVATEQVDFYSEAAVFEVTDSDVSSIEIKTRRGSTISGHVVVEGSDDPDVLARLSKLQLRAAVMTEELTTPSMAAIAISVDGGFLITGLRPGKARILFNALGSEAGRGFTLIRVEREGINQRDGIEVTAGENVSGVRVVLGYGVCIIRGLVKVEGGELPPNTRLSVLVRKLDSEMRKSAILDARGRFSIDSLMPGEYELTVNSMRMLPSPPGLPPPPILQTPNRPLAKQNVAVTNGVETNVTLVVDLSAKEKDNEK